MSARDNREVQNSHPGWAVRFSDGTYLGGAHGWFRTEEAFYADIYDTEEDARRNLKYVKEDKHDGDYFSLDAEIVPAWQPLCEHLRHEVYMLRTSNKIDVGDLSEKVWELENLVKDLKEMAKF